MGTSSNKNIVRVTCEYVGVPIHIWKYYDKHDINFNVYYDDNPSVPIKIDVDDLVFTDFRVTIPGNNIYTCYYTANGHTYNMDYIVPGIDIQALEAEYIGPNILIEQSYNVSDVSIRIVYNDSTIENIPYTNCTFPNDLVIHTIGRNRLTVDWEAPDGYIYRAVYYVTGRAVTALQVDYSGPSILIGGEYDPSYCTVYALMSDGERLLIDNNEIEFLNRYIDSVDDNYKYLNWTDYSNKPWHWMFIIQGHPRPVELTAKYDGMSKIVEDEVEQSEIFVVLKSLVREFEFEENEYREDILTIDEWFFLYENIVTTDNDGILYICYDKQFDSERVRLVTTVKIPYYDIDKSQLKVWYEGSPIEVGKNYDLTNIVIYLCEPGKDRLRLQYLDPGVIIDKKDLLIRKHGDNWFTIQYIHGRFLLEAQYSVEGIVYPKYEEVEYKVEYCDPETQENIDVTDFFDKYFNFEGVFNISWNQFLKRVQDFYDEGMSKFGLYFLYAPKNTGLYVQYDTKWAVLCIDYHTLKARIVKVYSDTIKEDKENGQTEKELSGE